MRCHFYNQLTNNEIEEYLEINDLIFLPIGVTEMHGAFPVDCETVLAQAISLKLAKECNGLILSDLAYFYAGATVIGKGTLEVSVREGIDYLFAILKSLQRQGFKKFIFVTAHAPAYLTVSPVLRDFFDQYHLSMLYIDAMKVFPSVVKQYDEMNDLFFGAYEILGRLDDIPLTEREILDCSVGTNKTAPFSEMLRVGPMSGTWGFYSGNKQDHGMTPRLENSEQRHKHASNGVLLIEQLVEKLNIRKLIGLMNKAVLYHEDLLEKYGSLLSF